MPAQKSKKTNDTDYRQVQEMIRKSAEENNPLNALKSVWFLVLAGVGVIVYLVNIQNSVEQNVRDINQINNTVSSSLESIDTKLEAQSEQFSLFQEELRAAQQARRSADNDIANRVTSLERDIQDINEELGLVNRQ